MTRFTLVYSPENDVLKNLLNGVEEDLSAASNLNWTVHGAPNSSDVEKSLESHTFMAGVVFNDSLTVYSFKMQGNIQFSRKKHVYFFIS